MSAVLVDTHVFIWWASNAPALSDRAREVLVAAETELLLSSIVPWEMAIKVGLGRLTLHGSLSKIVKEQIVRHGMTELPVRTEHALAVENLPSHHSDPFDRLLIAQCVVERAPIVTADAMFARYGIETIW